MSRWRDYESNRPMKAIPVERRVKSPCGHFVAAFYLISRDDDEESAGGQFEIMIYDAASEHTLARLTRSWEVNHRTNQHSGDRVSDIAFDAGGEALLINSGSGDEVNRVPFVAALAAIGRQRAAAPDKAEAFLGGDGWLAFLKCVKDDIPAPIEITDLFDLIERYLREAARA